MCCDIAPVSKAFITYTVTQTDEQETFELSKKEKKSKGGKDKFVYEENDNWFVLTTSNCSFVVAQLKSGLLTNNFCLLLLIHFLL